MSVNLVWITPEAEKLMAYCARVSNPSNQENPDYAKLLHYCIRKGHWSVFEMASMCVEVETSRIIADQVMRHRSFSFQTFSTRYAAVEDYVPTNPRRQDTKNRQSSHDDLPDEVKEWFKNVQSFLWERTHAIYQEALEKGIAKECVRDLLPFSTKTRMYMSGTIRSYIHYVNLRTLPETQYEHRIVASQIKGHMIEQMPTVAKALGWLG